MDYELQPYGKTARYDNMMVTITEKLDGTNGCVVVQDGVVVGAQSRKRKIKVGDDNFAFAGYIENNKDELTTLGDGYHYGEWCGPGIQQNPHNLTEKTFFLFNTFRPADTLPSCVKNVPILFQGEFEGNDQLDQIMSDLVVSAAESGYKPEGVIVYFHGFRSLAKYTFQNNASKWTLS